MGKQSILSPGSLCVLSTFLVSISNCRPYIDKYGNRSENKEGSGELTKEANFELTRETHETILYPYGNWDSVTDYHSVTVDWIEYGSQGDYCGFGCMLSKTAVYRKVKAVYDAAFFFLFLGVLAYIILRSCRSYIQLRSGLYKANLSTTSPKSSKDFYFERRKRFRFTLISRFTGVTD